MNIYTFLETDEYKEYRERDSLLQSVVGYIAGAYSIPREPFLGIKKELFERQRHKLSRHFSYLGLHEQILLMRKRYHIDEAGLNKENARVWLERRIDSNPDFEHEVEMAVRIFCDESRISKLWLNAVTYLLLIDDKGHVPDAWLPLPFEVETEKTGVKNTDVRVSIRLEADTTINDIRDGWKFISRVQNFLARNPSRKSERDPNLLESNRLIGEARRLFFKEFCNEDYDFDVNLGTAPAEVKRCSIPADPKLRAFAKRKSAGEKTRVLLKESGYGAKYTESEFAALLQRQIDDDMSYFLY